MFHIQPDPTCAIHAPLTGWRKWTNKLLGISYHRVRVVMRVGDRLVCNPQTVPYLTDWLKARGTPFRMLPTYLERVK